MKDKHTRKENLDILELKNNATVDDIKIAYRKLAKKCHPDLNSKNPEALNEFIRLKEAYDGLLSDEPKKILKTTSSHPIRNDIGEFFGSIFKYFKETFNFTNNEYFNNFNEIPEPFVDLRKIIRDKKHRTAF